MMETRGFAKRLMAALAIVVMGVASANAQGGRLEQFQEVVMKYQNHGQQQTKEHYLEEYMAKNLYYFVCKKLNRFNPESIYRDNNPADDVRLIPVGFVNNNWKCDTTTDPDVF